MKIKILPLLSAQIFDNNKYNVFRHSGYPRDFITRTWQPGDTKTINPFNRNPNRSSSKDHVFYDNISPFITRPLFSALFADRREPFYSYTRYNPFHY
jgi:hypothetical protein